MSRPTAKGRGAVSGIGAVLLLLGFMPAWGYEEIPVVSGGSLHGRVSLTGPVPPPRVFHLALSPNFEFCANISDGKGNRLLREFRVAPGGGFADVVVALVGVEKGKPFDDLPPLILERCRIDPFVTVGRNHRLIEVMNRDPIIHDVQAYTLNGPSVFAMFNKRVAPERSIAKKIRLRDRHYLFRVQCGVHPFMQSWGIALANPYYARSAEDGSFEITQIPPGTYSVIAWHPLMEVQAQEVVVASGQAASVTFQFDGAEVQLPLHDLQEGYRFETVLQPGQLFTPAELQRP